jgi:dUTP pyrophosphatase
MNLSLTKLDQELPTPKRSHPGDAGLDLYAAQPVILEPGERAVVDTGVAVAIPEGHAGLLVPRSGLAARHGITVVNAPGLIDSGYRGPLMAILLNTGQERVEIKRGDRIVQLVVTPVATPEVVLVETLDDTARGSDGLGSSGR